MSTNAHNLKLKAKAIKRAKEIAALKASGKTWHEISVQFGISRQRAQQIGSRVLD